MSGLKRKQGEFCPSLFELLHHDGFPDLVLQPFRCSQLYRGLLVSFSYLTFRYFF